MPSRASLYLPLILISLLTFGRVITHEFVGWDDPQTTWENPRLHPPTLANVAWYWTHAEYGLYIPVTYTAWAALAAVAQTRMADGSLELNPWVFHLASLVVHIIAAIVCCEVLYALLRRRMPAMIGAMLFAVHPVQVESVAWASGMKDLLAGCFSLAAIWQYLLFVRAREGVPPPEPQLVPPRVQADEPPRSSGRAYALAMLFFVLAMLSKPSAVVAPLIMAILDVLVLGRTPARALRSLWPMFLAAVPVVIIGRIAQHQVQVATAPAWTVPLVALDAIAFYLYKLFWPMTLTPIYARSPDEVYQSGALAWTWIAPAGLAIVLALVWRRAPLLVAAALVLVAGVLPVLGLVPFMFQAISTVADHYLYLAMLGPALAMAWLVAHYPIRPAYMLCAVVLALLAVRSILQSAVWEESYSLFSHAVDVRPDSDIAHSALGNVLARQGEIDQAIHHFLRAVEIQPRNHEAQARLAKAFIQIDRPDLAIEPARRAIELIETNPIQLEDAREEHLLAALALSRLGEHAQALRHLARSQVDPRDPLAAEVLARAAQPQQDQGSGSPDQPPQ